VPSPKEAFMITVVRYEVSETPELHGAPLAHAVRVVYTLAKAEVRSRLEHARHAGAQGIDAADVVDLDAGSLREAALEQLFDAEELQRARLGTEESAEKLATG
jgi:hypothetical protein